MAGDGKRGPISGTPQTRLGGDAVLATVLPGGASLAYVAGSGGRSALDVFLLSAGRCECNPTVHLFRS